MIRIRVSADFSGFRDLVAKLIRQTRNLRPLMANIGQIVRSSVMENFLQEGRPKWPDLKPSTKKAREKIRKWPGPILQVSRQLMNSITPNVFEDRVEIGTNKVYAAVMQFGAKKGSLFSGMVRVAEYMRRKSASKKRIKSNMIPVRAHERRAVAPWGDIPPRPFLVIQPQDEEAIVAAAWKYLLKE